MNSPNYIQNWVNGSFTEHRSGKHIEKFNPHDGKLLCYIPDSNVEDIDTAIEIVRPKASRWSETTPVRRGQILSDIVIGLRKHANILAECVAEETGKPPSDATAEVAGAILQGEFWAGEGMRMYGRSLTSGMPNKYSHTIRQPHGIVGLIVPANTPIANIAWKVFPALICGNTVILKASEDAPRVAELFGKICKESGLPDGVLNIVYGYGKFAGAAIVQHRNVSLISFTGSTKVGRWIAEVAGRRLARVSLELGGKNPFIVCDDADLEQAVFWASLSGFSNAGQRCASGSRIFVFENIYNEFLQRFVEKVKRLKLGVSQGDDLGPVINKNQQNNILEAIARASADGGIIHCGGNVPSDPNLKNGYYINPTIIDGLNSDHDVACRELFGPVVTVHPVKNIEDAVRLSNNLDYGLTAAIHTRNVDRAVWFAQRIKAGVANINLGTFGSEPHMPFGGIGESGNGTREPGVEALDVYSEIKNISFLMRQSLI